MNIITATDFVGLLNTTTLLYQIGKKKLAIVNRILAPSGNWNYTTIESLFVVQVLENNDWVTKQVNTYLEDAVKFFNNLVI